MGGKVSEENQNKRLIDPVTDESNIKHLNGQEIFNSEEKMVAQFVSGANTEDTYSFIEHKLYILL